MSDMLKTAGTIREIERLRASLLVAKQLNAELVAALEDITDHFAAVMGGPFLAGVKFQNGIEGIPTIAKARTALTNAKEG